MTKRVTALFLLLCVLLISGCNTSPKLTAEEYKNELMTGYEEFMAARMKIAEIMLNAEQSDRASLESSEFEYTCRDFESAMKRFEKMNPPDNYKDKHKKLVKSLDDYHDWLKAVRKFVKCTTPEEFEKALNEANGTLDVENGFLSRYLDMLVEVNGELS